MAHAISVLLPGFDARVAHLETDAAGEPRIVRNECPPPRELTHDMARAVAYARCPTCLECGQAIRNLEDAAYLVSRDRVLHAGTCFIAHLVRRYRLSTRRMRAAVDRAVNDRAHRTRSGRVC